MVRINVVVGREMAMKLGRVEARENLEEYLDCGFSLGLSNPRDTDMPNQHSADKVGVSAYVPRTVARRLEKLAKQRNMIKSALLEYLYTEATRDIELTPDDYRQIARETEAAMRHQTRKNARAKRRKAQA